MRLFDLHCDTITTAFDQRQSLRTNTALEISLERGRSKFAPWVQCFAIWLPDSLRGQAAVDYFQSRTKHFQAELAQNRDCLRQCITGADLTAAEASGQCGAILTVEGGAVLAGDLRNLPLLEQAGVRILTLTWNGSNEIGDGAMVEHPKGLTPFGRQLLSELEQRGIVLDVSHASDPLFYDTASRSTKPMIATHSNARAICDHPRNLTEEQIREICRRGGLIGLNLHRYFLQKDGDASLEDCFRHVYYFLSMGAEHTLAIGTDFDGAEIVPGLRGIQFLPRLWHFLLEMGLSEDLVSRIFYQNARDFLESL